MNMSNCLVIPAQAGTYHVILAQARIHPVIPAQAGIQRAGALDSGLRRNEYGLKILTNLARA